MSKSRPNPRLAKVHRSYTVDEIAKLYGIHRNTVRAWLKQGLPAVDQKRPVLVLGRQLGEFLRMRKTQRKRPCGPDEIYCMRCREPRAPADKLVRYHPITATQGNLVGICSSCGAGLYRRISVKNLGQFHGFLHVTLPQALDQIGESSQPSVNSDFMQEGPIHANASS